MDKEKAQNNSRIVRDDRHQHQSNVAILVHGDALCPWIHESPKRCDSHITTIYLSSHGGSGLFRANAIWSVATTPPSTPPSIPPSQPEPGISTMQPWRPHQL